MGRRESYPAWQPWTVLACMTATFAVGFAMLAVLRHNAYQSHAFDLGNMDQAVWNTLHGRIMRFTDMQSGDVVLTSRFAIHVEPFLILTAPLYAIDSGPQILLVLQAFVVAVGAVPAYLLARDWIGLPFLSLVFPAAYLTHPSLQNAVLDDFHAVTLSACFLLWALLFATRGMRVRFVAFALLAASTKEEIGLLVAAMSLILLRRYRIAAAITLVLGIAWFVVCVAVIIPHFNPAGHSPYLGRYRYFGHGMSGIVKGALEHPGLIFHVLTTPARLNYLQALLHPVGWTSLLGLPIFLVAVPSLAINMLSGDPTMYSGLYQYSAEVVPFVVASAAVGIGYLANATGRTSATRSRVVSGVLCCLVLVAALVDTRRYGFSPLSDGYTVAASGAHQHLEDRLLHVIPAEVPVSAADEIEPHLAERKWVYLLPTIHPKNGPPAAYLALDASIPSLPTTPRTLATVARQALQQGYGILRARDGVLILQRGGRLKTLPAAFFGFVFQRPTPHIALSIRWGHLRLQGITLHPRTWEVNRSRPAISVEAYFEPGRSLRANTTFRLYCSPVYHGAHPAFSDSWQKVDDAPTLDWFPAHLWPLRRAVHVAFLPLIPDTNQYGKVDVALAVGGAGALRDAPSRDRIRGQSLAVRLATVSVGY